MLKSVTRDFSDFSTLEKFEFEFYCDCCGKAIKPPVLEFVSGFKKKNLINDDIRKARDIIYAADHERAFERANVEMLHELNRCEICGKMICEDCTVYSKNLNGGLCCKKCEESEK